MNNFEKQLRDAVHAARRIPPSTMRQRTLAALQSQGHQHAAAPTVLLRWAAFSFASLILVATFVAVYVQPDPAIKPRGHSNSPWASAASWPSLESLSSG